MKNYTGWLIDLYAHPKKGVVLWLAGEDGTRHFFSQDFETAFYISGPFPRLREVWKFLRSKPVQLVRTERDDLYDGPQQVLEVRVASMALQAGIFREVNNAFPELTYYDVDVPLHMRYAAAFNVFPTARCKVKVKKNKVTSITALDTPWELDPHLPKLRELKIKPNVDPSHAQPEYLLIQYEKFKYRALLNKPRDLLFLLNGIFRQYDPDVILTSYGDTWLFSHLQKLSEQTGIPFNPNRDTSREVVRRKEVSFFNYGQAHYRGEQVHLLGRWHVDRKNCMTYNDYGLAGAIEQARVTGLPVQEVARRSPGAGISAMQVLTALRRGVLIPHQHQKGEVSKTYNQLFKADRGGLVFEPLLGVFKNVAILDFIMMYPSIMVEYNISPEAVGVDEEDAWEIPELGVKISRRLGLVPETLRPLRDKRVALKRRLKGMKKNKDHPDYRRYKALSNALKWLGVVAYGRLGFANSIFGRINAHEAVTHIGRRILLQAKAIAEDHGFTVLHLYVDSLFLCREDATRPEDFKAVMDEIEAVTRLPIDLEEVYSWMAFVSSQQNPNLPVSNRFFGLQPDGEYKVRGLAVRRGDTCAFAADMQTQALEILSKEKDPDQLIRLVPEVMDMVKENVTDLQNGEIPLEELVVTQTLSRELNEYRVTSALARAAAQLQAVGKNLRMGQHVRYLHTRGKPGVFAWDLPNPPKAGVINIRRYKELLLRAIYEVVQPLGVTNNLLRDWIHGKAGYITPADLITAPKGPIGLELPLFRNVCTFGLERMQASPLIWKRFF
jgi:DNA polymerase II